MRRLLILFLVLVALGAALATLGLVLSRSGSPRVFAGKRILTLSLDGDLDDYAPGAPLPFLGSRPDLDLAHLWRGLEAARHDDSVQAVAVRLDDVSFGIAKAQEVRRQLVETAASGKRVVCYFDTVGEGSNGTLEYYIATGCPAISLSPAGEVNLLGLWSDSRFLRGSLDKLKIEPSFLAGGRYKSAPEMFTERRHSPAAREELDALLDSYFAQIVDGIAQSRKLSPATVRNLIDQSPLSALRARTAQLVDRVEYADELRARLVEQFGDDATWRSLASYADEQGGGGGPRIAVVFATGTIVRGEGGADPWTGERFVGSRPLGATLSDLADDDGVKAVVLRVDSPGGSAVASDLLLRRVDLLRQKKPVVVSMSDLAASGGYYLAAKASKIVAEAGTLTGSIGVFSGKLATGRFEEELLGATHDTLSRGANAGIYSSLRPFDDAERARLSARLSEVYDRFIGQVAEGRSLPRPEVERIAQGRIWSGEAALENHLVDRLGGFGAALEEARQLAGIDPGAGRLEFYPRRLGFWEWFAGERPLPFPGSLVELRELARSRRVPGLLELPQSLAHLARPF